MEFIILLLGAIVSGAFIGASVVLFIIALSKPKRKRKYAYHDAVTRDVKAMSNLDIIDTEERLGVDGVNALSDYK